MGTKDKRIDAYIGRAGAFAQPILRTLRASVHTACPQVEETIRWGMPFFAWRGLLCHMAAFKQHCAFGFWKGSLVVGRDAAAAREAMGHFGRLTAAEQLPSRARLAALIRRAMALNAAGVKSPTRSKPRRTARPTIPPELQTVLRRRRGALAHYRALSPSQQRDYVEWLAEAKQPQTRARRLAQAVAWIGAGKARNWKYAM